MYNGGGFVGIGELASKLRHIFRHTSTLLEFNFDILKEIVLKFDRGLSIYLSIFSISRFYLLVYADFWLNL
jgi:hypothetical protein